MLNGTMYRIIPWALQLTTGFFFLQLYICNTCDRARDTISIAFGTPPDLDTTVVVRMADLGS